MIFSVLGPDLYFTSENGLSITLDPKCSKTWSHFQGVPNHVLFGSLVSNTFELPLHQKEQAFKRSFEEAKIQFQGLNMNLCPKDALEEIGQYKCSIIEKAFELPIPKNYDLYLGLMKILENIKTKKVNLKYDSRLEKQNKRYRDLLKKERFIHYRMFETASTRLKVEGFPILTVDKSFRHLITPNNDFFVEFDFNAADIRSFYALADIKQPENDLYEELGNEFSLSREDAKKKAFVWLYTESNSPFQNLKDQVLKAFSNETPYGTKIKGNEDALNKIVQGTTSEILYEQMAKVNSLLQDGSYICWCIHDSLTLDLKEEDLNQIPSLKDEFEQTRFGRFKANVKIGRNYGEMRVQN